MSEDMTMTSEELGELRAQALVVALQDVQLGRLLDMLILHVAHSHGLDPAEEDAKAAELARTHAREEEDAQVEAAKHPAEPAAPAPAEPAPVVEQQAEPAAPSWTAPAADEGETHAN